MGKDVLTWYIGKVQTAARQQNGYAVKGLLLGREEHERLVLEQCAEQPIDRIRNAASTGLPSPFQAIVEHHLVCKAYARAEKYEKAFEAQSEALRSFQPLLSGSDTWWIPALDAAATQLRHSAYAADRTLQSLKRRFSNQVPEMLMKYYRQMVKDRQGKIEGCLMLTIHMIKLYFSIKSIKLVKPTLTNVQSASFRSLDSFPLSERVTYHFYNGRYEISQGAFDAAVGEFESALALCDPTSTRNQQQILEYYIPVRMVTGDLPRQELVSICGKSYLIQLCDAIRHGRLDHFEACLASNQVYLIQRILYSALENLKKFVYRTVLKKLLVVNSQLKDPSNNPNFMRLQDIQAAFRISGEALDLAEVECVLANLIYDDVVKGYIAHNSGIMVSKTNPFPQ